MHRVVSLTAQPCRKLRRQVHIQQKAHVATFMPGSHLHASAWRISSASR
jgi:hypothetical protein